MNCHPSPQAEDLLLDRITASLMESQHSKGHGFSRAITIQSKRALAPEVRLL
jgi:hypothetical protein